MKKCLLVSFISLFVFLFNANAQKKTTIAFVEDANNYTVLQTGVKDALTTANYNVVSVSSTNPFDFDALDTCGIVIISRTIYSSSINDADSWGALDVPVLTLGSYVLGYDALNLLGGVDWTANASSNEGTATTITKGTSLVTDDVFNGVTTNGTDFDLYSNFYLISPYKIADFAANSNSGIPMVAIANGSTLGGDSAVVMARWAKGVETYPQSGTTPAAVRSYLGIGDGIWQGATNYDNFTDKSKQLLLNEVHYLMTQSKNGIPTSVKNSINEAKIFSVYPNPATNGVFMLAFKGMSITDTQLNIYNMAGQKVYSTKLMKSNTTINTGLSRGMYFVKVKLNDKDYTQKVIVN